MPSSTDFKALTREISGNVSQLRTSQPEVMQSFNAMGKAALAPGAIDAKTKELIALGIGVAGRHVWLQSLPPDQVPACGPGLDFMLDAFPLKDVIARVLTGSAVVVTKSTVPVGTNRKVAEVIRATRPDAAFDVASNP